MCNGNCSDGCLSIRVGSYGVPVVTHAPFGINNVQLGAYGANGNAFQLIEGTECKYDYSVSTSDKVTKTSESTCVCKNCDCKTVKIGFLLMLAIITKIILRLPIKIDKSYLLILRL